MKFLKILIMKSHKISQPTMSWLHTIKNIRVVSNFSAHVRKLPGYDRMVKRDHSLDQNLTNLAD